VARRALECAVVQAVRLSVAVCRVRCWTGAACSAPCPSTIFDRMRVGDYPYASDVSRVRSGGHSWRQFGHFKICNKRSPLTVSWRVIHATAKQCGHRCQPLVIGPVAFIRQHFTRFVCRSRCEGITEVCRPYCGEVAVIDELSSLRLAEHRRPREL